MSETHSRSQKALAATKYCNHDYKYPEMGQETLSYLEYFQAEKPTCPLSYALGVCNVPGI